VELLGVAVDDDGVRIAGREAAELAIDQAEAPHHVFDFFIFAVALPNVLLDGAGAGGQNDHLVWSPVIADAQHVTQGSVILGRILRHVGFERDARALEEDHLIRRVVPRGVAIVGVVKAREILRDADRIDAGGDILEYPRIPHALLALAVRSVVVQVGKLPHQRALAHAGPADNCHSHATNLTSS
jgi:hypothetical protein